MRHLRRRSDRLRFRFVQAALNEYWGRLDRITAAGATVRKLAELERAFDEAVRTSELSNLEKAMLYGAIHDGTRRVSDRFDECYTDPSWRKASPANAGHR